MIWAFPHSTSPMTGIDQTMCAIRIRFYTLCLLALAGAVSAEGLRVDKIEPPHWWIGMKHNRIQLMVYGEQLSELQFEFDDARIVVEAVHPVANDDYAFVDIVVPAELPPGEYRYKAWSGQQEVVGTYALVKRDRSGGRHQGFSAKDTIYLITPDRFANGDTGNDRIAGILDEFDPTKAGMRHGGDLKGIIQHLDYLEDLGITAIWLNPILENNGINSYHGYKATDLYRIDARFGSNELYREFVDECHQRGIKVIFDHVSNHIGIRHPWIENLPSADWLNGSVENHLSDKHYLLSLTDPHSNDEMRRQLKTFWFVDRMPDVNQANPHLAKYLIQNSIWWIEYSGLDGIREDTYPYADQKFLGEWAKAIRDEYPDFNIVGEIWATKPAYIARFQQRTILPRDFETHLPAVMDFPLMESYRGFVEGTKKLRDLHASYSEDFLYTDTSNLLVFLDNHDTPRINFIADGNTSRVKVALTLMLMGRGIPQLLYGTELGMRGGRSHVELRADFPGGFPGDGRNAFVATGRTAEENEMHSFVRKLLHLRKQHAALAQGTMLHFAPTWNDDTYMFFRKHGPDTILVVANGNDEERRVDFSNVEKELSGKVLLDLMTDESILASEPIRLSAMTAKVWLLKNRE